MIIIGAIVTAILIILVIAYYSGSHTPAANSGAVTGSNSAAGTPTFSGEDTLKNIGITSSQVSTLEQTLEQYLRSAGKHPSRVGFGSARRISANLNFVPPVPTVSFAIQLDNKNTYQGKMDCFYPGGIRLYVSSLDGTKLLYDSQNVGGGPGH